MFRALKIPSYSLEVETEPEPVKPATEEKPVKKTWTTAMNHTGPVEEFLTDHYAILKLSNRSHAGPKS